MNVNYHIKKLEYKEAHDYYTGKVVIKDIKDADYIIKFTADRGSTTTEADIRAVLSDLERTIVYFLQQGCKVSLGDMIELYPAMKARFSDPMEKFNSKKHKFFVKARVKKTFAKKVISEMKPEKVSYSPLIPHIKTFANYSDMSQTDSFKPGEILSVSGKLLKFNAANEDEGLFFLSENNRKGQRVTAYVDIKPGTISFQAPQLPPGDYTLELRVRKRHNSKISTDKFATLLTCR